VFIESTNGIEQLSSILEIEKCSSRGLAFQARTFGIQMMPTDYSKRRGERDIS